MRKNKRGGIQDVALAMIILFVASIMFLTVKYSYGEFVDRAINNTHINESQAAVTAFQDTNALTDRFDYIVFVLLMGFTLAILISGWLVGGHPLFSFIYFLALVIIVAVSSVLSFVWFKVSTLNIFTDTISGMPLINLILSNFPVYITIVGLLGMLVAYAKPAFVRI